MHDNLTILAEFYPDTLTLIAKKYGFKIGEFRYQVMQNGVFLSQSDIELIDTLVAEHYAAKREIQGFAMKLEPKELRKFIADSEIEAMSKIEILSLTDAELVLMVDSVINQSVNVLVNTANALNSLFVNQNKQDFAMDNSVMQKIIDLQTEITKRDDLIAKLEVFIMTESKKRKGLMDAFYQEFKDTDIFLKRQPKK